MKQTTSNQVQLLFDSASGQYIPKRFALEIDRSCVGGVKSEDLDYLAAGPGGCLDDSNKLIQGESVRGEYYWDVWQTVLDKATVTDSEGNVCTLYQDGDVWLIPDGWEFDESRYQWRPPESETLRRYKLPAHWASSIFNGDDSGLEQGELEQIDSFIKREGLEGWTEADCGESYFSHSNDATSLGGDVAEYTFVKI